MTPSFVTTLFLFLIHQDKAVVYSLLSHDHATTRIFRSSHKNEGGSRSSVNKNLYPRRRRRDYESFRLDAIREATFGMGCFWEPSESMLEVDGVLDSVVGYAGGALGIKPAKAPSYDDVCDGDAWVEAVRVVYNDDIIPYEKLLDQFLELQNPVMGSRQYASIIFPEDDTQNDMAQNWRQTMGRAVAEIEYSQTFDGVLFYRAEEYHQQYWSKWRPRVVAAVFLLSLSSGLLAPILSVEMESNVKITSNLLLIFGGLYNGIFVRLFDTSTRELVSGSFATDYVIEEKRIENKT